MSDPFVGEIRMFAGNFAPRGFAFCSGQLLAISQNAALFSLFGTIYGGDGESTFALPDLRGRVPVHMGTGAGLSSRPIGQKGGAESVALTAAHLPAHRHTIQASSVAAPESRPGGNVLAADTPVDIYQTSAPTDTTSADATTEAGGGGAHPNVQPFLCINFIVSLVGVYPSRT